MAKRIDSAQAAQLAIQTIEDETLKFFKIRSSNSNLHGFVTFPVIINAVHVFAGMTFVPEHNKINKMTYAPSKDSGQFGHPDAQSDQSLSCAL